VVEVKIFSQISITFTLPLHLKIDFGYFQHDWRRPMSVHKSLGCFLEFMMFWWSTMWIHHLPSARNKHFNDFSWFFEDVRYFPDYWEVTRLVARNLWTHHLRRARIWVFKFFVIFFEEVGYFCDYWDDERLVPRNRWINYLLQARTRVYWGIPSTSEGLSLLPLAI